MKFLLVTLALCIVLAAQVAVPPPVDFVCPMDPEVRSKTPASCPRCGMKLVAGIPEPAEFLMDLKATPAAVPAAKPVTLEFRVRKPKTGARVHDFEVVHEKLFHLFVISQDLDYFAHIHPEFDGSVFRIETTLPHVGNYRLLADFYPKGGTPQLIAKTLATAGCTRPLSGPLPKLPPDLGPQKAANLTASLTLDPPEPIAGKKTMMFIHLDPADGLERYIGAWGHMLAASADLIDTIHEHPFLADGGPDMQFNVFFPRPGTYRVWIQFQRSGVVNTVAFTVPVMQLE